MKRFLWAAVLPVVLFGLPALMNFEQQQRGFSPSANDLRQNLWRTRQLAYIYPDASPLAPRYRQVLQSEPGSNRFLTVYAVPASAADTIRKDIPLCIVGTPAANPVLRDLLPEMPFAFDKKGFTINGYRFADKDDILTMTLPHPRAAGRYLQIITGNSEEAILSTLAENGRRRRGPGAGDYSITRGDQLICYGFFAYKAGRQRMEIDPAREFNFLRQQQEVFKDEFFEVRFVGNHLDSNRFAAFIEKQHRLLLDQCKTLDLSPGDRARLLPIRLILYETAEQKTMVTRRSQFASWEPEDDAVHLVFNSRICADDYQALAQVIAQRWAGGIPNARIREAAGVLFSENWGREGYPVWAGRLFHNGDFLPLEAILADDAASGISPHIAIVELATFLQFILFHDGINSFKILLHNTPARMTRYEVGKRFSASLLQQWQRWCAAMLADTPPGVSTASAGFLRGFCYAHEGYSIYNGYMGSSSEKSLARLQALGTTSISITPFGYTSERDAAVPLRMSLGAGSENDESVIVAASMARSRGMQIMLKPHILLAGRGQWGWPGDIDMADQQEWPMFFTYYRRWITHYAMLAQMYQTEYLCIGTELSHTTVGHEREWRELVTHVRKIYGGKIVYAANWGEEFEKVTFWEAFDAIGVNSYYPLSQKKDASDAELLAGARQIADKIAGIARRYRKPVIITEIGFASRDACWVDPHRDGRGERPNVEAQARAYRAILGALESRSWLRGIYFWKWPTYLEDGGPRHSGFTPNGKPAEEIIAAWFGKSLPSPTGE